MNAFRYPSIPLSLAALFLALSISGRATESVDVTGQKERTVSALHEGKIVALCEMRAGRLNPTRVFHLS